jgi:hypothetical protein
VRICLVAPARTVDRAVDLWDSCAIRDPAIRISSSRPYYPPIEGTREQSNRAKEDIDIVVIRHIVFPGKNHSDR